MGKVNITNVHRVLFYREMNDYLLMNHFGHTTLCSCMTAIVSKHKHGHMTLHLSDLDHDIVVALHEEVKEQLLEHQHETLESWKYVSTHVLGAFYSRERHCEMSSTFKMKSLDRFLWNPEDLTSRFTWIAKQIKKYLP